jgi:hypothetical protein
MEYKDVMKMKHEKITPLPKHLQEALDSVSGHEGDDIYFVLGYLSRSTAHCYVSRLKKLGLAHTYVSNGISEVWTRRRSA